VERVKISEMKRWIGWQYENSIYRPAPPKAPKKYEPWYFKQCWIDAALEEGVPWICEIIQQMKE